MNCCNTLSLPDSAVGFPFFLSARGREYKGYPFYSPFLISTLALTHRSMIKQGKNKLPSLPKWHVSRMEFLVKLNQTIASGLQTSSLDLEFIFSPRLPYKSIFSNGLLDIIHFLISKIVHILRKCQPIVIKSIALIA